MPRAGGVADEHRAVGLAGIAPRHGAGDEVRAGIRAVHAHLELGVRLLLALGEYALVDVQLRARGQRGAGLAHRSVHAADLRGVHGHHRVFFKKHLRHRVDAAHALALAGAHVLFKVGDARALFEEEAVDAVVACLFPAVGVYAAAGDDGHIRALADEKVVVDQIVHAAVGDAGGDGHRLALRARADADVQPRLVGLALDADIFGGLPPGALAVFADVERAGELAVPVRDGLEQALEYIAHHANASFWRQQAATPAPRISSGNISSALP